MTRWTSRKRRSGYFFAQSVCVYCFGGSIKEIAIDSVWKVVSLVVKNRLFEL